MNRIGLTLQSTDLREKPRRSVILRIEGTRSTFPYVGRIFGRGQNSVSSGGVFLRGLFKVATIISPPNAHSCYLGEGQYTIDPSSSVAITAVDTFPPTL